MLVLWFIILYCIIYFKVKNDYVNLYVYVFIMKWNIICEVLVFFVDNYDFKFDVVYWCNLDIYNYIKVEWVYL